MTPVQKKRYEAHKKERAEHAVKERQVKTFLKLAFAMLNKATRQNSDIFKKEIALSRAKLVQSEESLKDFQVLKAAADALLK